MVTTRISRRGLAAIALAGLSTVALPSVPAWAQKAKDKTPTAESAAPAEVDFDLTIETIETVDSSLDEAAIRAIFDGQMEENAEGLASLDAASISIPEIVVLVRSTEAGETTESTLTFSDLVFTDVVDGVAAKASLGGSSLEMPEGSATVGSWSVETADIGAMLALYGLVPAESQEMTTLYTNFVMDGGSFEFDDASCTFGTTTGAEFKARPLQTTIVDLVALSQELEASGGEPDAASTVKLVRFFADILTAFESSEVVFGGYECTGLPGDDGQTFAYSIGEMVMDGMRPGFYPSITMNDMRIDDGEDGFMSFDQVIIKQMDLSNTIDLLMQIDEDVDEAWLEANSRALFPAMEGFALSNFSMDIPAEDGSASRLVASVDAFDLTLGNYINGIPASLDTSATGIVFDLPQDQGDEFVEQLAALGVTSINAGFRMAAHWDAGTETIAIEEVSLNGVDLGAFTFSGELGNASPDLFDVDTTMAIMAGMALTVTGMDLELVDEGISDIVLAAAAAEQGSDAATMRPVFAGLAEGTVIGMMAGVANAADLGKAVNSFVSGAAKTLTIGITSKDENGIPMADFMAAEQNPALLLDKVDVTAVAQ